jgi:hypothetical protein
LRRHVALDFGPTAGGVNDAAYLHQYAVVGRFDDATSM